MFNPFKYRPVSQQDDEDEDVLYQGKSIPLSNLGKANSDDEVELELPRKQPTAGRPSRFTLCIVIAIIVIFVSLLVTLVFYVASPLAEAFNGHKTEQETNRTTVAQSTAHQNTVSSGSTAVVVIKSSSRSSISSSVSPAAVSTTTISSSSTAVPVALKSKPASKSSSISSPASTGTVSEATSKTAVDISNNKIQSTASSTSDAVVTTALSVKTSIYKQTFESTASSSIAAAILPTLTTPTVNTDVVLMSLPSTLVTSTAIPTEGFNNNSIEMLNPIIPTSSIEPSVTGIDSSGTVSSSINHVSTDDSTISIPTTTNIPTAQNNTIHWNKMNLEASSETTPFVIDVNNDGIDDVIYTRAHYTKSLDMYYCTSDSSYEDACMEDTGYPVCGSTLVAVNGLNGELIWLRNFTRPVFGIRCVMDVDEDGETDCFVIGRYHQWDTVNKATGETIWEADTTIGYAGYNFYYPLPLEDIDDDGVVDILNIHGGDQSYGSRDINRSPALIVIISGKTGKKLIDPIVVPDGRESYMSPVRYTFAGKDVILFGTGGETINGSLWAITVDSIKEFVKSGPLTFSQNDTEYIGCSSEFMRDRDKFRPTYDRTIYQLDEQDRQPSIDCPSLGQHLPITNKHDLCLYELYNSSSKGMIIPPVIIDMNNDNVQDLIIQSFSGHVLCLNGVDGEVLWHRYIPNSESYNIPAPLFYNDDDTPDIFLRVNIGEWDDYEYSYVVIIDGTDGKALWAMNSSYATMQSAVTLMSVNHSQDAVVFFAYNPIDTNDLSSATVKKRQIDTDPENSSLTGEDIEEPHNVNFENTTEEDNDGVNEDLEHLGEQFWNLSNASFPDPLVDPKGFIKSCKFNYSRPTTEEQSYLYLITRNVVTRDRVDPIAAAFPGILIPGYGMISSHSTRKRHGSFQISMAMLEYVRNNAWRCSYVQYPSTYSPITPVVADLNHDGKLELIYGFQLSSDNNFFSVSLVHSVFDLHVQTIENMVESDLIDFSKFLPMEEQSWTTYMGSKGDGMYNFRHK